MAFVSSTGRLADASLLSPASSSAVDPVHSLADAITSAPTPARLQPQPSSAVHLFSPALHGHLVLYLAALHGSCITHDRLSGTFAPPLHHEKLLAWWKDRLAESTVLLWLQSAGSSDRPAAADLIGAAVLRNHPAETSPHVATVELLLTNPRNRQQGGERMLLDVAEQHALQNSRTLLTSETSADSLAAATLTSLGFIEAGRIPGFVVRPTGVTHDQVLLYKNLAPL